ncbi:MAG: hypothetical protein U0Z53_23950 [Blastocatellia bacterium]
MAEELKRLQADVKDHTQQIRELTVNQSRLYFEFQLWKEREAREREREVHEREKEAMRREMQQLHEQLERQQLPPLQADEKTDND